MLRTGGGLALSIGEEPEELKLERLAERSSDN